MKKQSAQNRKKNSSLFRCIEEADCRVERHPPFNTPERECILSGERRRALGANMERILQKLGQTDGHLGQRILELNPDHAVVQTLIRLYDQDAADARIEQFGRLLYEQALIAEGSKPSDPAGFARRINELLIQSAR